MRYRAKNIAHVLLAVDPGKRKLGVALGIVDPKAGAMLVSATTLEHDFPDDSDLPGRVAVAVWAWVDARIKHHGLEDLPFYWVSEWPVKYDHETQYHARLDELLATLQAMTALRRAAKTWTPSQWKGAVPKRVHHVRVREALTPDELVLMPTLDRHDTWDAVGIFLFATERLGRGGTR